MKNGRSEWFSAGLVIQPNTTQVLVIDYLRLGRKEIKFPGGSEKSGLGRSDASPEATLNQEFNEEIFKKNPRGELMGRILEMGLLFEDPASPDHVKYLFETKIEGVRRDAVMVDEDWEEINGVRTKKPDEILSPPYYIEAKDLLRASNFARWHRKAFEEAIKKTLVKQSPNWLWLAREMHLLAA